MNRKRRALLIACAIILVCLFIVAGGSFALFTDSVQVRHHLKAGRLDVTLIRTNLTTLTLDNKTGTLKEATDPRDKDFSKTTVSSTDNIFDINDSIILVPGTSFEAEMLIGNNTDPTADHIEKHYSNVAYVYWLDIVLDEDKSTADLADQIKVTVTTENGDLEKYLSADEMFVGTNQKPIGKLALGESANFTVKIEFIDDFETGIEFDNNKAMVGEVKFDLIVNAVQVTK